MQRYWWVNHKQTFKHEISGRYLWSPKFKTNGDRNYFYDTMSEAQPGDIVLSYASGKISYFGIVSDEAYTAVKPKEFGSAGDDWDNEGWQLPITWNQITPPIRPKLIWDDVKELFPKKYSPLNKEGGGNQGCYLTEITEQIFQTLLQYSLEANPILFQTILSNLPKSTSSLHRQITEVKRVVKQRIGQLQFRQAVIKLEKVCPITGVGNASFLRASHIKPWRACDTDQERLDPYNGLALAPHIDQLFDQGFITFDLDGYLKISAACPPMLPIQWNFEEFVEKMVIKVPRERQKYIKYHNRFIYKN